MFNAKILNPQFDRSINEEKAQHSTNLGHPKMNARKEGVQEGVSNGEMTLCTLDRAKRGPNAPPPTTLSRRKEKPIAEHKKEEGPASMEGYRGDGYCGASPAEIGGAEARKIEAEPRQGAQAIRRTHNLPLFCETGDGEKRTIRSIRNQKRKRPIYGDRRNEL